MGSRPAIETELKNKDPSLFKKYKRLSRVASRLILQYPFQIVLNRYDPYALEFWTDHGPGHSSSVIQIIDDLYRSNNREWKLSPGEIFTLLSSAWLHDWGMFSYNPPFSRDQHRKYHGWISGKVLLALRTSGDIALDYGELLPIILVCAAHQSDYELKALRQNICQQRLELLASILRISDALHISKNRTDLKFLNYFEERYGRPAAPSIFEWNVNCCAQEMKIRNKCITFVLSMPKELEERFLQLKTVECKGDVAALSLLNMKSNWRTAPSNFVDAIADYIPYYLADHILSIKTSSKWKDFLGGLKLRIEAGDGNTRVLQMDQVVRNRKKHYEILTGPNIVYSWMPSANIDPQIEEIMSTLRSRARAKNRNNDVFMFLFDSEHKMLNLWCSEKFYEEYNVTKDIEFYKKLSDVRIPMKCGIAGYVAWMGGTEEVENGVMDLRVSYGDLDRVLKLQKLSLMTIVHNECLVGVFLVNSHPSSDHSATPKKGYVEDIMSKQLRGKLYGYLLRHKAG